MILLLTQSAALKRPLKSSEYICVFIYILPLYISKKELSLKVVFYAEKEKYCRTFFTNI